MNTNNPDILFFVRREYGAPSIELRAYKVEKVNNEFAFLELLEERAIATFGRVKNNGKTVSSNIDFYSGDFQSVSLHHEYGKNNCMYNSANNIPDLMKDMKRWQLSPIDRRNYERFRKVALGIYRQAGIIDFTTLETTPIKNV